jgi:tRNA G18 (ribose-2'-O)-methylase SpoU
MPVIAVDSADDDRLIDYRNLTDVALRARHEPASGMYIAESASVIERAVEAGHRPRSILMQDSWLDRMNPMLESIGAFEPHGIPVFVGDRAVLESLTGFHVHRGALAAMHRPELPSVASVVAGATRIVVLEDLVDHTNVGAIFRSAAGLGIDAILVTPRCADPLYRRSVRVSMGTVFQIPWTRIENWPAGLDELRAAGFTIAALSPRTDTSINLDDLAAHPPEKLALVFGTEGDGLTDTALSTSDTRVSIPMHAGVDSLNVAAASAVVFWALTTPPRDQPAQGTGATQ